VNANAVGPGGVQIPLAEDAEDGWSAGAGLSYALSENIEVRADYTWFGLDNVDVNSGTVALGFNF
jgi:opacity protein-like surface antigen